MNFGVPLSNPWTFNIDMILDISRIERDAEMDAVVQLLMAALREQKIHALKLDWIEIDNPHWTSFRDSLQRVGLDHMMEHCFHVGLIDIEQNWEAYQSRISRNMRKNLNRSQRRLEEIGEVTFRSRLRDATPFSNSEEELAREIKTGFRIEDAGYKGATNSSVIKNNLLDFYVKQAQLLDQHNMFELEFLSVNGKEIAFEFGYFGKGNYFAHKVSFDPEFSAMSPGHALCYHQIQELQQQHDCHTIDTVGMLNEATSKWATGSYRRGRLIVSTGTWIGQKFVQVYETSKKTYGKLRGRKGVHQPRASASPSKCQNVVGQSRP